MNTLFGNLGFKNTATHAPEENRVFTKSNRTSIMQKAYNSRRRDPVAERAAAIERERLIREKEDQRIADINEKIVSLQERLNALEDELYELENYDPEAIESLITRPDPDMLWTYHDMKIFGAEAMQMRLDSIRTEDEIEEQKEKVMDNYKKICSSLNLDYLNLIRPYQTHSDNIVCVNENEKYENVDGLLTNEKGRALSLTYADCTPLYFFDPNKKVIANIHSGWVRYNKKDR